MKVYNMSRELFDNFIWRNNEGSYLCISISSLNDTEPFVVCNNVNNIRKCLFLHFNNVDIMEDSYSGITEDHARQIAEFIEENYVENDEVVIHCDAGSSRSSGVAAALCEYFNDDKGALSKYKNNVNLSCYSLVLNALKNN